MNYTEHVLDRRTGEFTEVSAGDWITVTELGDMKGVTARQVRTILREMEFLYVEGGRAHNRHRLMPWVIQQGLGRHIPAKPPKVRYPFDVIGPQGKTWIEARWINTLAKMEARPSRSVVEQAREALNTFQERRLGRLNVHGCVLWLCDCYPDLTHTEMAGILDVTQQLVSRYVDIRSRQRASAERSKSQELPDLGKVRISVGYEDDVSASGGVRCITQAHNMLENASGHAPCESVVEAVAFSTCSPDTPEIGELPSVGSAP